MKTAFVLFLILSLPLLALAQGTGQAPPGQVEGGKGIDDILNMDIEQLAKVDVRVPSMDIPVTSVTKEESTVGRSAAAVFVITPEMIRRSGATSIPEALRMAPGLDVAQINSSTWAISSRGFNGLNANKLLVLIDGRTVYTPVSSGVWWDVQDVVLEDVERIEVIRGPGGTLWGANAVNGVINVITKKATDTQGAYVNAGGGTVERSFETVRYGGKIGDDAYYRVYGKYFDRSPFYDPNMPANDGWNQGRFGFRTDWNLDRDGTNSLTVQGDHYVGTDGHDWSQTFNTNTPPYSVIHQGAIQNDGDNVLLRLRHVTDERSDWTLQTYYDYFERLADRTSERVRTFDIDFQYRFPLWDRQQITCGAGYRYIDYQTPDTDPFTHCMVPPDGYPYIVSQFVQDEITLVPDLWELTLGCKLEENNYTGLEYQPTARLLWTPDRRHSAWGAVSRAVRTPTPADRNLFATDPPAFDTVFPRITGNPAFQSETLLAYEAGYRTQATDQFSWDIATFYNVYGSLRSPVVTSPPIPDPVYHVVEVLPVTFLNGASADTYGVELATNWAVSDRWRLYTQYTFLRMMVHGDLLSGGAGENPWHQVYLHSSWNLREDLDFDLMARYIDSLTSLNVPSYISMDLRLAWRPRKQLELALVGQNLLATYHYEFGPAKEVAGFGWETTEVPRSVYGMVTWRR